MMDEKFGWNDGNRLERWTEWRCLIDWTHANSSINLINWPTARIDHRAAGTIQLTTKIWIANVHIKWQRIASVQFHIVDFPVGEQLSILLCIADNAWIASARIIAEILVNAKFQATRMNLIDWDQWTFLFLRNFRATHMFAQRFHSTRKTLSIGHQFASVAACFFQPAVVHVDVLVANICISFRYNQIGHGTEQVFADKKHKFEKRNEWNRNYTFFLYSNKYIGRK